MRGWTFWDRVAYACLWVAALILAADTGPKLAPDLAQKLPSWAVSPLWGFAPLALIVIATIIFIAGNTGLLAFLGPRHPIKLFLERDSSTNLFGIQTFPNVSYVQPSVITSRRMEKCSAWITRVEYDVGDLNFALEFNERFPVPWSKATSGNDFQVDLEPGHPPIRLNVAVFDQNTIGLDRGTPTNLHPLLQRIGLHRFTIFVSGLRGDGIRLNETFFLEIEWAGPGKGTLIKSLRRITAKSRTLTVLSSG